MFVHGLFSGWSSAAGVIRMLFFFLKILFIHIKISSRASLAFAAASVFVSWIEFPSRLPERPLRQRTVCATI